MVFLDVNHIIRFLNNINKIMEKKHINTPIYTPEELVRIELLRYENPEGLHPIEESWRNLCKKLIEHVEILQESTQNLNNVVDKWQRYEFTPMKFPEKFKPKI